MKKIFRYFKECFLEMKKVAWPNKTAMVSYTGIVIVTTIIFAIILGVVDYVFLKGVNLIF